MYTVYTYDMLGKCTECGGLNSPTLWLDTLEVMGRTWALYPGLDDGHWTTEISEGRSWIQFDHTLNLTDIDFE